MTSRAQRAKDAREGGPHPTTDTRLAERRRLAMLNAVGNWLIVMGFVLWVSGMVWAGFRIMYLEREARDLDVALEQCLEVVGQEVGPGYL